MSPEAARRELAKRFRARHGYIRRPDEERTPNPKKYKRGWEARFPATDETEAEHLRQLLLAAGFAPGKPWRKHTQIIVPLYGRWAVLRLELLLMNT